MDFGIFRRRAISVFKERPVRNFLFISVAFAVSLPLYYHLFVHPSLRAILTKDKAEEALGIAEHLSSQIKPESGKLERDSLPVVSLQEAVQEGNEFGLRKIRVFSSTGEVLFSSDAGEIGTLNEERYLQEVLEPGKFRVNVVKRGIKSLDGEVVSLDLVEAYVPLVRDGRSLGAFEVYYDITQAESQMNKLLAGSFGLIVAMAVCFLALVMAVLYKANEKTVKRQQAEREEAHQEAHKALEERVQERTQKLVRTNDQLQVEVKQRKEAEERTAESGAFLQSLFNGISDPLLVLDEHLRIRILNDAAVKYCRIGQYSDAIRKPCREVIPGGTPFSPCDRSTRAETFSSGKTVFERRGVFDADRVERIVVDSVRTVPGNITGKSWIIRITDVTEQKKVEKHMIRADRLASLGQLSGAIAHEIRSPLSGINLLVDVLCDPEKFEMGDREREIFAEIKGDIHKINTIITRILEYARDTEMLSAQIAVNDLIRDVVKFWNAKVRNREIKLELFLEQDLPVVLADAIGLQQVMNNLIQNAVEAMGDGGVLTISSGNGRSSFHEDRPAVKIIVEDTGPGISPEQQQKVFNPFYTTKPRGTGLGLAISHRIIESQGGVLSLESQPGKGAKFTVELPAIWREESQRPGPPVHTSTSDL